MVNMMRFFVLLENLKDYKVKEITIDAKMYDRIEGYLKQDNQLEDLETFICSDGHIIEIKRGAK